MELNVCLNRCILEQFQLSRSLCCNLYQRISLGVFEISLFCFFFQFIWSIHASQYEGNVFKQFCNPILDLDRIIKSSTYNDEFILVLKKERISDRKISATRRSSIEFRQSIVLELFEIYKGNCRPKCFRPNLGRNLAKTLSIFTFLWLDNSHTTTRSLYWATVIRKRSRKT